MRATEDTVTVLLPGIDSETCPLMFEPNVGSSAPSVVNRASSIVELVDPTATGIPVDCTIIPVAPDSHPFNGAETGPQAAPPWRKISSPRAGSAAGHAEVWSTDRGWWLPTIDR